MVTEIRDEVVRVRWDGRWTLAYDMGCGDSSAVRVVPEFARMVIEGARLQGIEVEIEED